MTAGADRYLPWVCGLLLVLALTALSPARAHPPPPSAACLSPAVLTETLRAALWTRGWMEEEVEELVEEVGSRLGLGLGVAADSRPVASKRTAWRRIVVQPRFAAFGTKLLPTKNRGDTNGPALLRYGRSG